MDPLKRFRLLAVRSALAVTLGVGAVAFAFDSVVAKSLLAGGLAGALAFWIIALRTAKVAILSPRKVQSFAYRWTLVRLGLYGGALLWSYNLDRKSLRGVVAACIGLFIIRIVIIVLGFTGWDLEEEAKRTNGPDR